MFRKECGTLNFTPKLVFAQVTIINGAPYSVTVKTFYKCPHNYVNVYTSSSSITKK